MLLSDHISNHVNLNGRFPADKEALLAGLDEFLEMSEEDFGKRPPWWAL